MSIGVAAASVPVCYCFDRKNLPITKRTSHDFGFGLVSLNKRSLVMEKTSELEKHRDICLKKTERSISSSVLTRRPVSEKLARKRSERKTYLVAAVISSLGVTSAAALAVYYRFVWQTEIGEWLLPDMFGTFLLTMGSYVGMEFWARWAHKALWHASLWQMHESHHRPRDGAFELNDVFAIINAAPAIALLHYGFFNSGLFPGLCLGLGITIFGIAYMFVHDGLVHHRFPVGPIADVPYLREVAAAHQLYHTYIMNGVPYGLFLGPKATYTVSKQGDYAATRVVTKERTDPIATFSRPPPPPPVIGPLLALSLVEALWNRNNDDD